jgi:polyvinyl alcohol dehydrogenase (cytochrome)
VAIVAAPLGQGHALLFGDQIGWFYALRAETGGLLWKKKVEEHDTARLTAAAAVHDGVVFVPVASWEETRSVNLDYPCCTFRGSVVAMRVEDGSQVWKSYFIRQSPRPTGENNSAGTPEWGPSGAGSWAAPTLDAKRGVVYITTGDNYSEPATDLSDAVIALEMKTGRIAWAKQTTSGDVFSSACNMNQECPGPDHDYGSSVVLESLPDGGDILLAGQKSGVVYALDPDNGGTILWQARVGKGGINGGVQWGMASDGQQVYAAVSDIIRPPNRPNANTNDPRPAPLDPKTGGGFTALRIRDGEKVWYAPPSVCDNKPGCTPAQSAAVTAIPGVVFSGSHDGHIRGFSTEDGRVVWDFDTAREFETVNGVAARGGSLDGPGPVLVDGMLFVNSGYGRVGAMAGNVLLAFAVE